MRSHNRRGGHRHKKTTPAAAAMNTVRGPSRSRKCPDDQLSDRGEGKHQERQFARRLVAEMARPPSRSSNTLGSANVVDWNTMLETAVVKNTIMDTRSNIASTSLAVPRRRLGNAARARLRDLRPSQHAIADADQDRDDAGNEEGSAPAAVINKVTGDQGGAGDAKSCSKTRRRRCACRVFFHFSTTIARPTRMIDGGEYTEDKKAERDLKWRAGKAGQNRGRCQCRRKTTLIMPSRLHLSASQPAGSANTPTRKKPVLRISEIGVAQAPIRDAVQAPRRWRKSG